MLMTQFKLLGQYNELANIPQESIYIHVNAALLFTGEQLLYKTYCLNNSTKKTSDLSKIAYVSLQSKKGKSLFFHSIKLENASGTGDFFIPTSVPTGSYKLIGYTQWMKNGDPAHFFQTDVWIINPYEATNETYLESSNALSDSLQKTPLSNSKKEIASLVEKQNSQLQLKLNKTLLRKREKISVEVWSSKKSVLKGNFSVSVRKVNTLEAPQSKTLQEFYQHFLKREKIVESKKINALPELRGALISGTVLNKENDRPASGKQIALSIPGKNYHFQIATTNEKGEFYFNLRNTYERLTAALELLGPDSNRYQIQIKKQQATLFEPSFTNFKIPKSSKNLILQRSIHNQIENAYREVRLDSMAPLLGPKTFYNNLEATYNLDDYTRFNTVQETIIEVVDKVSISKTKEGKEQFKIRPIDGFTGNEPPTLLFVDGVFIKEHQQIINMDAKRIKFVHFSREKYLIGSHIFRGILSLTTSEADFLETFYAPAITRINLSSKQAQKNYFVQTYAPASIENSIPDYRYQLLWKPKLVPHKEPKFEFYTSDVSGTYELILQGFTLEGRPISIQKHFTVE